MKEITFQVEGMVCSGCENRVKKALQQIIGVKEVTAYHEKGTVTVVCEDSVSEKQLKEKIENLDFKVN